MTLLVGSIFHMTRKIVSEMTYNVSMGTLNPTIPYHTIPAWSEGRFDGSIGTLNSVYRTRSLGFQFIKLFNITCRSALTFFFAHLFWWCPEKSGTSQRKFTAGNAAHLIRKFDRRASDVAAATAVSDDANTHEPAVVSWTHQPWTIGIVAWGTRPRWRVSAEHLN